MSVTPDLTTRLVTWLVAAALVVPWPQWLLPCSCVGLETPVAERAWPSSSIDADGDVRPCCGCCGAGAPAAVSAKPERRDRDGGEDRRPCSGGCDCPRCGCTGTAPVLLTWRPDWTPGPSPCAHATESPHQPVMHVAVTDLLRPPRS